LIKTRGIHARRVAVEQLKPAAGPKYGSFDPVYTTADLVYTGFVAKHLIDIDDEALGAAKAELGTETIKETVNEALRRVSRRHSKAVTHALDVLGRASLEDRERAWR
jgi:Arc/MetJ family transcription regulator